MSEHMQVLGDVVRKARFDRQLTQNDVADHIDVDVRTILNIENHKGNPKLEILYPLIRALEIDPRYIFYPELEHCSASLSQLELILAQCTDEEIHALIPICETVLSVLRENKSIQIQDE